MGIVHGFCKKGQEVVNAAGKPGLYLATAKEAACTGNLHLSWEALVVSYEIISRTVQNKYKIWDQKGLAGNICSHPQQHPTLQSIPLSSAVL